MSHSPNRSPSPARAIMMQSQQQSNARSAYGSPLPAIRMNKDQLDKSVARLYKIKPPPKDPGPVVPPKVFPKDRVEERIAALYDQAIEKKKNQEEVRARKYLKSPPAKTISPDDITESVQRVYQQAMKQKETGRADLERKLRSGGGNYAELPKRKLAPDGMAEANSRLFQKPMEKRQELQTKLEEEFLRDPLSSLPKRSESEWAETVNRLYSGGK